MRAAFRQPAVLALVSMCAAGSAYALSSFNTTDAGWTPLVTWWGNGNAKTAVNVMGQQARAYSAVLHHSEWDKPTQKFLDDSLDELGDFDLAGWYKILPEERGEFREFWVQGELKGDRYVVTHADGGKSFRVGIRGPRRKLGDFYEMIRAKPLESNSNEKSYLIGLRAAAGVGPLDWTQSVHAATDFGRIVSTADPRPGSANGPEPSSAAKAWVRKMHPKLQSEDQNVLGLLYDAYPTLSDKLTELGQMEDLRTTDTGKGYQHITWKMSGLTDRLAKTHKPLAKQMEKLGKIGRFDVDWVDSKNRVLMKWFIDSETLTVTNECYVKDGNLIPFKDGKIFVEDVIDPLSDDIKLTRANIVARLELLGVVLKIGDLKADLFYDSHGSYADMGATFTRVPKKIDVEGAALGFVPTGLIDAMIPGNIRSLTMDFLRVAAKGNDKRGAAFKLSMGAASQGADGVVEVGADFEALDNYLVKIAVGMVNNRLIPPDSVIKDAKQFMGEVHEAFQKDLARYRSHVGG